MQPKKPDEKKSKLVRKEEIKITHDIVETETPSQEQFEAWREIWRRLLFDSKDDEKNT